MTDLRADVRERKSLGDFAETPVTKTGHGGILQFFVCRIYTLSQPCEALGEQGRLQHFRRRDQAAPLPDVYGQRGQIARGVALGLPCRKCFPEQLIVGGR